MASRRFLLALTTSAAVAQMGSMPGLDISTTAESGDAMITGSSTSAAAAAAAGSGVTTRTGADMISTMTSIPSAIMPSDISATLVGSTAPTTLVVDTMTPPAPSSGTTWATTTPGGMSGMAMSTGSPSANTSNTGTAAVNGMGSVYDKISMGLLALCIVASAAAQM